MWKSSASDDSESANKWKNKLKGFHAAKASFPDYMKRKSDEKAFLSMNDQKKVKLSLDGSTIAARSKYLEFITCT